MAEPYIITGVQVQPDDVFPRYEIRDLQKDHPEQFTLFILGWTKIREPGHQPLASQFVQQGGIHGLPYERWPGDPNASTTPVGEWGGYCNHASVLFPTWHRPSILLLEQSIGAAALEIAQGFAKDHPDEADKWLQAARELRFPFWDWTLPVTGTEGLPRIFHPDITLDLQAPGGQTIQSENILAFYRFGSPLPDGFDSRSEENPLAPTVESHFDKWDRTYRWPNTSTGTVENPKEDIQQIDELLQGQDPSAPGASYRSIVRTVANLFTFPDKTGPNAPVPDRYPAIWDEFSNTRNLARAFWRRYGAGSVESSHNLIHLIIGGSGGHMMDNDYASFDPIFYLHHCNVDRLFALWEYVYPDYWMGNGFKDPNGRSHQFTQAGGTFTERDEAALTQTSNLTPFRNAADTYWTSNDTHSLEVKQGVRPKHYTYPEVAGVRVDRPATDAERRTYRANLQRYFSFNPVVTRNRLAPLKQGLFTSPAESALPPGQEPVVDYRRFVIDVELVEHAFNGSYLVVVTAKAGEEELSVGAVAALGRGDNRNRCAACRQRREAGSVTLGVIPIPAEVILKILEAKGLNNEEVGDEELISAIKGSFQARLVRPGGKVIAEAAQGGTSSGGSALPREITPKLTLYSANVSAPEQPEVEHDPRRRQNVLPDGPFELYDWQNHEGVLTGDWKTAN